MICPNCKTKISCGCQLKRASDKTQVCSSCVKAYEEKLNLATLQKLERLKTYTK